jgi:hypothetical protein
MRYGTYTFCERCMVFVHSTDECGCEDKAPATASQWLCLLVGATSILTIAFL